MLMYPLPYRLDILKNRVEIESSPHITSQLQLVSGLENSLEVAQKSLSSLSFVQKNNMPPARRLCLNTR